MILFYFLAITDPQLLCTVCHCICWDSEDIFWQGGMSSDNLGVDGADSSFMEIAGALSSEALEAEAQNMDERIASPSALHPSQPETPTGDLFGYGSDAEQLGLDLQGHMEESAQVPTAVQHQREDTPISKSDYNRALFEARLNAVGDSELKLPWEQGVWKAIFSDDDSDVFPNVLPPVPGEYLVHRSSAAAALDEVERVAEKTVAESSISQDLKLPFYSFAVKVLPDRDAMEENEKLWNQALYKWQQVFEILDYPGQLGKALLHEQVTTDPGAISVVLRDSLGIKSPRTAIKRAQTLLQYFSWLQSQFLDWDPWNRNHCLQYLRMEGQSRPSASRGLTLLEAFRFARFVLEIPIPDQLMSDPQLRGRAQRLMAEKETYKPARPLKVSELALLERTMQEPLDPIDAYMLGAIIFAILSRSRWSDLKHIHQIWIERTEYEGGLYGFVEARTKYHKTATSLAKKQLYMPLVAPVLGVTTVDWTKHWVQACESLGVSFEKEPFGALCRAASHGGVLCKRSCTTEEVGIFLNKILKTNKENAVTSHSLKHTTLSWCAAYGLDEPSRTLLGHHELQGAKAMTVYSRDLLTRPLQLFCSMLANIRLDHFRPDESRTSRMVDLLRLSAAEKEAGVHVPQKFLDPRSTGVAVQGDEEYEPTSSLGAPPSSKHEDVVDDEASSEIPSTDSSSYDSSSEPDEPRTGMHIEGPVWRNIRSHVVHKCSSFQRQTLCGRLVNDAHFELMQNGCSTLNARCSRCFKGEVISDVSGLVKALDQGKSKRLRRQ